MEPDARQSDRLDPQRIPGMALGALGLRLLAEAAADADQGEPTGIDVTAETGRYGQDPAVREAVIEAWAWLHAQGMTVITSGSGSRMVVSVTRRGRRALAEGIDWARRNPFHEA
ncbi:hypothetical protein [Streptacidiphilus cavernicola]|uniref:Uncharacterized protein n=1 Tax=Streptacidiphilus cavernicola TaxID=3342716 RepID=A0ABV6W418_9ACTN